MKGTYFSNALLDIFCNILYFLVVFFWGPLRLCKGNINREEDLKKNILVLIYVVRIIN